MKAGLGTFELNYEIASGNLLHKKGLRNEVYSFFSPFLLALNYCCAVMFKPVISSSIETTCGTKL